jgi:hypothetical protein
MDTYKDSEVIINLKLLKLSRYYNLIDPNGKKIFGYNISRLIFTIIFVINFTLFVYSNLGFVVNVDYKLSSADFLLIIVINVIIFLVFFETCLLLYRLENLVDLLDVTRIDFLKSELCCKNNNILYDCRNRIKKYTDFYFIFNATTGIQWILFGLLKNVLFFDHENVNTRIPNIINMPFPVNTAVYNQYYILFFIIEFMFILMLAYCFNMIDMFLLSYGWILVFQYNVLCLTFKDLKHENKRLTGNNILKFLLIHFIVLELSSTTI